MQWLSGLNFINKHSAYLLIAACLAGFAMPEASNALLPKLPVVLFFLMFFTLLGMNQPKLLKVLAWPMVWRYAVFHTLGMSILFVGTAFLLGLRGENLLALAGVTATGALFGTPAIVRSIGVAHRENETPAPMVAMALTIASTILMPVVLLVNLWLCASTATGAIELDWALYGERLLIFIAGPMLLSFIVHSLFDEGTLHRVHAPLSKVTIVLLACFPFGLVGAFREYVNRDWSHGVLFLFGAVFVCFALFAFMLWWYRASPMALRVSAAVASGGRNVLLTHTVAGVFLGSAFLPLIGAMQLPVYALPLVVRWWMGRK